MATVSTESSHQLAVGSWAGGGADSKSERYLAKRLAAAGADYKGVALTIFLLGSAAVALSWLAVGVLAEHWLVPGGLPRWVRWTWLGTAVSALVIAIVRWVLPLIRYRVNLVYAARAIEREFPDLHNDLVNAVLVSSDEEGTNPRMVRSLKRRAARQLSGVPSDDSVVDRSLAVSLAYAVAVMVAVACLYEVLAPKSLLTSSRRLFAPWTSVAAPSRVQIAPLRLSWRMPGDHQDSPDAVAVGHELSVRAATTTIIRGRQLVIGTTLRGLRDHEQPTIMVRTLREDGTLDTTAKPWHVVMERQRTGSADGAFTAVLPDGSRGLDHSIELALTAGDARTEPVKVLTVDAPSLLVQEVQYDFPAYTRLREEAVRWQGDIRAIEGTKVTIMAVANRPMNAAWIDFGCDGRRDKPLLISASDPSRASVSFELRLNGDGTGPQWSSYRLLFEPRELGGESSGIITEELQHGIEVVADMAPEISLLEPQESPLRVPPDGAVRIRVRASDPDFGLARVGLEVRLKDGPPGREIVLLAAEKQGVFQGGSLLVPRQLGAQPGATLEYRGVAADTRPQRPNETRTQWQALIIDEQAAAREPRPEPQPEEKPRSGEQPGENKGGEASEQNRQPADAGREGQQPEGNKQPGGQQQSGGENQPGRDAEPGGGQQPRDGQAAEPKPGDGPGRDGQNQDNRDQGAQNQDGQGQAGKGEQGKPGEDQNGPQTPGQMPGQEQGGAGKPGAGKGEQGQPKGADQQSGGNQPAGKQPGPRQGAGQQDRGEQPTGRKEPDQQGQAAGQQAKQGRGEQKQPPRDTVAADGTNDGEAMDRILEHRRQQKQNNSQQSPKKGEPQDGQSKDGQSKDGQSKDGQQKEKNGQPNPKDGEQNEQQPCTDGKPCGKEGCSTCNGGSKSGGGKPGSNGAGGQSGGGQSGVEGGQPTGQQPGGQQGEAGQQAGGQEGKSDRQSGGQAGADGQQPGGPQRQSGRQDEGGEKGEGGQKGGEKSEPGGQPGGEGGADDGAAGKETGPKPDGQSDGQGDGQAAAGEKGTQQGDRQPAAAGQEPGAGKPGAGGDQQAKQSGDTQPSGSGEAGNGAWGGGEGSPQTDRPDVAGERQQREMEWGDEDLSHARNAADLAVEHLQDSVAAGDNDVLDALGWTADQAQAFIDRWQTMRRLADSDDPRQRGEFERAVRSLGLRPGGVRSSRDVPSDVQGGQAEGRRSRPPSEYREQVRAYLQGTSGE